MGFETNKHSFMRDQRRGLKYPYGIWNVFFWIFFGLLLRLKYPYGIWNLVKAMEISQAKEFEVSLWDLKLRMGIQ